jgi:hypothetical protein
MQQLVIDVTGKPFPLFMQETVLRPLDMKYGLGVGLEGSGPNQRFGHGGRDQGFDARLIAYENHGHGAVIMINTNDNSQMISRIMEGIAREYDWPAYSNFRPGQRAVAHVAEKTLVDYTGRYEFVNNQMLTLVADQGRLWTLIDGFPDEEFLPEADDRFHLDHRDVQITFLKNSYGDVRGFLWTQDGHERKVPRIGPLFRSLKPQSDPDPARTEKIAIALRALGTGGTALDGTSLLTSGARTDHRPGIAPTLAGLKSLIFLTEQDMSAHPIERHKGKVSRIVYYKVVTDKPDQCILVHLTADGLITDFDIVDD